MPTEIYKTKTINALDGTEIEIIPLRIKYLKQLMEVFSKIEASVGQDETLGVLAECVFVAMKQFVPDKFKDVAEIEDSFDVQAIYDVLKYCAGIDLNKKIEEEEGNSEKDKSSSWDSLDLAKLESEVFLLGIWKNFEELEFSISIEELMQILSTTRDLDYEEKRFMAALQGVDIDQGNESERGQKEWENLKAKVASGGQTTDSRDILALQGTAARQAGFGIGLGLGYEDQRDPSLLKNS
jgi:hypothetical protein